MKRALLLILHLLLIQLPSFSQKEGYIGIFGMGVGLDFNHTPPGVLVLSYSAHEQFFSNEGTAAISDQEGNLLFYTNGANVWNRNHVFMANGDNIFPFGLTNSTSQMLIVPLPKDPHLYYVFSIGSQGGSLVYSIVDMRRDYGMGKVILKEQGLMQESTEKLCIAPHEDGDKVWMIAHEHNSDAFRAYLIDGNGINPTYVESKVGEIHHANLLNENGNWYQNTNSIGYLKPSPDGKNLVSAILGEKGLLEYFDFDPASGIVSNARVLFDNPESGSYGVAFSPDGSKLYHSRPFSEELVQYNLEAGSTEDIISSATLISSGIVSAMQLGPDGKIYVIGSSTGAFLDVIHDPNEAGELSNFEKNGLYLMGGTARLGLPEFSYHIVPPDILVDEFCAGGETYVKLANTEDVETVQWNFGDPFSNDPHLYEGMTASYIYSQPGSFTISAKVKFINNEVRTFTKKIEITSLTVELGQDLIVCTGDNFQLVPKVTGENLDYRWSTGSTLLTSWIDTPGKYWLEISNGRCSVADTINIDFISAPRVDIDDVVLCQGELFDFKMEEQKGTTYVWENGSTMASRKIRHPGTYRLSATNQCGSWDEEFTITKLPKLKLGLPEEVHLCKDEVFIPEFSNENAQYRWQDGSTNPNPTISAAGIYHVEVFHQCEKLVDSVQVFAPLAATEFNFPNVITPNGDEYNEYFVIDSRLVGSKLWILNRWGREVYSSTAYANNWNARGLPDGVYFYLLEESCSQTVMRGFIQVMGSNE